MKTNLKLEHTCGPKKFVELWYGPTLILYANFDDDGWEGLVHVESTAKILSQVLDVQILHIYL